MLKTAGRWTWKSSPAKECVTTHLPKQLALKMDGAQVVCLYIAASGSAHRGPDQPCGETLASRRVRWCAQKCLAQAGMEPPPAQILVVVANIRTSSWMTEVEKGFVSTAVEHELANPKPHGNPTRTPITAGERESGYHSGAC